MKAIATPNAPTAGGHYSQGIIHDGLVYVAGQLPIVPGKTDHAVGSIEEQTEQVLRNIAAVLEAGGSSLSRTLQMTIYVSDISLWGRVNETYARILGDHKPARAVVPVNALHFGYQIEVQAIGAVKGQGD
ncbi:MAG: RidA family protein [Gemmatimonadales bacterium]|jgi:reactive intermediate/imine deaminase